MGSKSMAGKRYASVVVLIFCETFLGFHAVLTGIRQFIFLKNGEEKAFIAAQISGNRVRQVAGSNRTNPFLRPLFTPSLLRLNSH